MNWSDFQARRAAYHNLISPSKNGARLNEKHTLLPPSKNTLAALDLYFPGIKILKEEDSSNQEYYDYVKRVANKAKTRSNLDIDPEVLKNPEDPNYASTLAQLQSVMGIEAAAIAAGPEGFKTQKPPEDTTPAPEGEESSPTSPERASASGGGSPTYDPEHTYRDIRGGEKGKGKEGTTGGAGALSEPYQRKTTEKPEGLSGTSSEQEVTPEEKGKAYIKHVATNAAKKAWASTFQSRDLAPQNMLDRFVTSPPRR